MLAFIGSTIINNQVRPYTLTIEELETFSDAAINQLLEHTPRKEWSNELWGICVGMWIENEYLN
jgi:hypothetical protein